MAGGGAGAAKTGVRFPIEAPENGAAVEIAEGVLWARIGMPNRLAHVNVCVLDDGDGWTVIDTGLRHRQCLDDWAKLRAGPLAGKPVRRGIGTHHHPDHIGLVGRFMREDDAEFWTTRTAYLMTRMLQLDHHDKHPPEQIAHWVRGGMASDMVDRFAAKEPMNFSNATYRLPLGYTRIAEGDEVVMGGRRWHVRMGNGHAPEHATFWSKDDHLVIVGDQAIPGISSNLGVHPTEPEADPVGEWLESCERLLGFAREDHLAIPGHKAAFTGLPIRFEQLINNHHGAIARLRKHLTAPRTAVQCFVPIFGREIEETVFGLALNETYGHLNHMLKLGEVTNELRSDGALWWRLTG